MKNLIILLTLLTVLSLVHCQQLDPNYSFAEYVVQFGKSYDDEQYPIREAIFNQNYQAILELEAQGNGECHFEVNNFTDWTDEEKTALLGYNKPEGIPLSTLPPKLTASPGSLTYPASLDYRDLNAVSSVKNQGNCGSCWAFSTTALYQSLLMKETGVEYDLSEQYVLQCSGSSNGCNGGYPIEALQKIQETGIPLQSTFPYRQNDYYYSNICYASSFVELATPVLNTQHYGYLSDAQIKQLLFENGPLSIGIYANTAFNYYSNGVFSSCPSYSSLYINHAVLLIGYTNSGHWIIKNSWGENWGMNGFGIIHKDWNCGLNTYVDVMEVDWPNEDDEDDGNNDPSNVTIVQYKAFLSDSSGDGWHGLSIGIRQEGTVTSTFGSEFMNGGSYGPILFDVKQNRNAVLEVVVMASYTDEVGFTIFDEEDNLIFSRCAGSVFTSDTIFYQWCPGEQCLAPQTYGLVILMTDTYGDGWNGNVFGLKQNGQVVATFGEGFNSGYSATANITVQRNALTQVVVYNTGNWRSEVRFIIKNTDGDILFQRSTGSYFYINTILGSFCPGCINTANVRNAPISPQLRAKKPITDPNDPNYEPAVLSSGNQNANYPPHNAQNTELIIVSSILGFFVLLFLTISIIFFILWKNERKFFSKRTAIHSYDDHLLEHSEKIEEKSSSKKYPQGKQHFEGTTNQFDIHREQLNSHIKPDEEN